MLHSAYEKGELNSELQPDWYATYRDWFIGSCIDALAEIVDSGMLGGETQRDSMFVILGVSDSLMTFTDGVKWSQQLNTSVMHSRFASFAQKVQAKGYY